MSESVDKNITEPRTYTVQDIARILKISRTAAYRLTQEEIFKSVRIGTAIRISRKSFDAWLDEQIKEF